MWAQGNLLGGAEQDWAVIFPTRSKTKAANRQLHQRARQFPLSVSAVPLKAAAPG